MCSLRFADDSSSSSEEAELVEACNLDSVASDALSFLNMTADVSNRRTSWENYQTNSLRKDTNSENYQTNSLRKETSNENYQTNSLRKETNNENYQSGSLRKESNSEDFVNNMDVPIDVMRDSRTSNNSIDYAILRDKTSSIMRNFDNVNNSENYTSKDLVRSVDRDLRNGKTSFDYSEYDNDECNNWNYEFNSKALKPDGIKKMNTYKTRDSDVKAAKESNVEYPNTEMANIGRGATFSKRSREDLSTETPSVGKAYSKIGNRASNVAKRAAFFSQVCKIIFVK